MDIVARTDSESRARASGGSTFEYSPFLIASAPADWRTGNRQRPLVLSDSDSATVGQVMANVLSWVSTGRVAALGAAQLSTPFTAPEGGMAPQVVKQRQSTSAWRERLTERATLPRTS
jgi:hypothetical protein